MYLSKNEEKTVKILLCFLDPIFLYQSFIKDAIVDEIDVAERVGYQKKKKRKKETSIASSLRIFREDFVQIARIHTIPFRTSNFCEDFLEISRVNSNN